MQLKEKKNIMERDKRKLEAELGRQRQTIGKQAFFQVVSQKPHSTDPSTNTDHLVHMQQLLSNNNPNESTSPSPSNKSNSKETPRRQWDKTPQNALIDIENNTNSNSNPKNNQVITNNGSSSTTTTSSMSTPSSSASQSPPMTNNNQSNKQSVNKQESVMSVDLSKAYFSRDEVMRAIESLKEKYGKEAGHINSLLMNGGANLNKPNSNNNTNNSNMVKEIEILNNKLSELQNEINRLTLLQQQKPSPNTVVAQAHFNTNGSFILGDERKHASSGDEGKETSFNNNHTQSGKFYFRPYCIKPY